MKRYHTPRRKLFVRAIGKWNNRPDPAQELVAFCITIGSLFVWIMWFGPFLMSLLASHTNLADSHPSLYAITNMVISGMMLPWSFSLTFGYLYLYHRHCEKKKRKGGIAWSLFPAQI